MTKRRSQKKSKKGDDGSQSGSKEKKKKQPKLSRKARQRARTPHQNKYAKEIGRTKPKGVNSPVVQIVEAEPESIESRVSAARSSPRPVRPWTDTVHPGRAFDRSRREVEQLTYDQSGNNSGAYTPPDVEDRVEVLGPRTGYCSGVLELLLYEPKFMTSLLVFPGSARSQMSNLSIDIAQIFGKRTVTAHSEELDMDLLTTLAKPKDLRDISLVTPPDAQVVTLPNIHMGSVASAMDYIDRPLGQQLRAIIQYHLARLQKGYFFRENHLDTSRYARPGF